MAIAAATPLFALPSYRRQNLLNEFASLQYVQLQGVYVSLTQGDPTVWSGVLFVRKGPYSPAVFRFKISFGSGFPLVPPLITFAADAFHPLLTPLTTITYTTGLAGGGTAQASDRERLPPGAFSLRHGFPQWYERNTAPRSPTKAESDEERIKEASMDLTPIQTSNDASSREIPVEQLHVVDILRYVRQCFEDEEVLDFVPFELSVNPGAWYGWRAHREKTKGVKRPRVTSASGGTTGGERTPHKQISATTSTPSSMQAQDTPSRARRPGEWNWEGVWEERVKKAVQASLSKPVLFGTGATREDEIRFHKGLDPEELENVHVLMRQHLQSSE